MTDHALKYNKAFDELTDEEKKLLEINKKSIADFVEQSSSLSDVPYATRNAHAKTYVVTPGKFIIHKDIPDELKPFFDKDEFDLLIRFSNAHLKIEKNKRDIPTYGFSVKVMDENHNTIANYPLVNFPLFPINSVSAFLKIFTSINRLFIKKWSSLFPLIIQLLKASPSFFILSFLKNIFQFIRKRKDFILSFDYFSIGVYRLGENMIKIRLRPISVNKNFEKNMDVKEAMKKYFMSNDYRAEVFIQICYNIKDQPINQLNVEWKNSPYIKIGEIKIEKNSLLNPNLCENEMLSFNPFESKPFFQPVGKIQKLRNETYKISMQTRLKINKLLKYK
ncbi:catalase family protein [Chryseobacterium daecheongense]|uniref:Catalase n=1 Tax=Chryseobacterium daecheongense TaxID=192389 RepID=A0A3N0VXK1_9FLAO|nr:catalase [Chryseobacterium daecheongense]ROH97487.1 catalase [Chryseobacterium daecheongense]TDX93364.1 hypothetical protein BCF50_2326 [Chryseobacterium daecheongense]